MFKRKTFIFLFSVFLIFNSFSVSFATHHVYPFTDIANHEQKDIIVKHYELGLLKGYPSGEFRPDTPMQFSELVTLVNRYFCLEHKTKSNFLDISGKEWYADEAAKAKYYNYLDKLYLHPDEQVTFQDIINVICKFIDIDEQAFSKEGMNLKDTNNLPTSLKHQIEIFAEMGYINTSSHPDKIMNRAEIINILSNTLGYIVQKQEDIDHIPNTYNRITLISSNLVIENKKIVGNLYIPPGITGEIIIKNTEIMGQIEIAGGNKSPIVLDNVTAKKIVVAKSQQKPIIQLQGASSINGLKTKSNSTIIASDTTIIDQLITENTTAIQLEGNAIVKKCIINGHTTLNINEDSKIFRLDIHSIAHVEGTGTIIGAYISNSGVEIENRPLYVRIDDSIEEVLISGKKMDASNDNYSTTDYSTPESTPQPVPVPTPQPVHPTVTGISIASTPTKTLYTVGEQLNLTGLRVILNKSDGSSEEVLLSNFQNKHISISPENTTVLNTIGNKVVTLTVNGYTTSFNITIHPMQPTNDISFYTKDDGTVPSMADSKMGGANKTFTITPNISTNAVHFLADNTTSQSISISGAHENSVTLGPVQGNQTFSVATSDIVTTGGSKTFDLTVSENGKLDILYNITVTILPPPEMLGTGTSSDPFIIQSIEDLIAVGKGTITDGIKDYSLDACYRLDSNLDFESDGSYQNPSAKDIHDINENGDTLEFLKNALLKDTGDKGFKPIGDKTTPFEGEFNGNGKTISHLYIRRPNTNYIGLFGYTNHANINNLGLVNIHITGFDNVGGLIGMNDNNSTVSGCYSIGSINGNGVLGGLVGNNCANSTLSKSYSSSTVSGVFYLGGLVGISCNHSIIQQCYSIGEVTTGSTTSGSQVGGLVGILSDASQILSCYSLSNVTGSNDIGGLVGANILASKITDTYATGIVTASGTMGGLVGENRESSQVQNSIALNNALIDTTTNINIAGIIVGHHYAAIVNNCYAKEGLSLDVHDSLPIDQIQWVTVEDFKTLPFFQSKVLWNLNSIWEIKQNANRPTLVDVGDDSGQ